MAIFDTLKKKYTELLSGVNQSLNDQQGWFRGGQFTPGKQISDIQSASPVTGVGPFVIPNFRNQQVKGFYNQFSTPEGQVKFNETPVTNIPQFLTSYAANRYVAPIMQVPYNVKQVLSKDTNLLQKGAGLLGVAGGVATAIPDPIQDVAFPVYDYLKGVKAAQLRGESTAQSYKTGLTALSGQKPVGLGEASTTDKTAQGILNIAEIPLTILAAGKISKMRASKEVVLKNEGNLIEIFRQYNNIDSMPIKNQNITINNIERAAKKIIPGIENNKELQALKETNMPRYLRAVVTWMDDTLQEAKNPSANIGLNTKGVRAPNIKERGLVTSVKEAGNVIEPVKTGVSGTYIPKSNKNLMGEAEALLRSGATIDFKNTEGLDKKIAATIQEAINQQKAGNNEAAANLFNNLSEHATELGRSVQAFSLLEKMSPEAISLSVAGRIKKFNATHNTKIPELTGEQQKMIADKVAAIDLLKGREKNIAMNELQNSINEFFPSSVVDKALAVWKAGLLTSLRTHERNFVGNAIHATAETLKDIPATAADIALSKVTGQRTKTFTVKGISEFGSKDTVQQMKDIISKGYDPAQQVDKFDYKQITWGKNALEQLLKKYTDTIFRTLGAEDKPFYNSAMARSLYDQAAAEAINVGKRGDAKFIESLVKNPNEKMIKLAVEDANIATFKNKNVASNVASSIKRSMSKSELGKLASEVTLPFTGVPSSIFGQILSYSPAGLIKGITQVGNVAVNNLPDLQRQAVSELGRGVIGTGIFAMGAYLASKGLITGQPKDADEAALWDSQNKPRNSIFLGGKWRSLNSIGPEAVVFLAGSKLNQELSSPEGSLANYGVSLGKDYLDQSFLQGVQAPVNAITDPTRYGKSYFGQLVSSPIPNIVKDVAKATDTTQRETNTVADYAKLNVPGVRNTMLPRRDVLGNEMPQEPTGVGAFIDLFNSKTPIKNDVVNELDRLNNAGFPATPSKLEKTQTVGGVKRTLTPQELDSLEAASGPAVTQAISQLMSSQGYINSDDQTKAKAIDDIVAKVRKQVRGTVDLSQAMPDVGYVRSKDSPQNILQKFGVYGEAVVTDPGQTIKAVINGNPVRKVEGDAVILERRQGLGSLDAGDKTTQVDHIIALTLGGTNDKSNLQILSTAENKIKGEVETYLYNEMKAGRITKSEAQKRDLNWRNEVDNLPVSTQKKLVDSLSVSTTAAGITQGQEYKIVNPETGTVSTIDLSKPIIKPTSTGFAELDKLNTSQYNSAISKRISDIKKVYDDGQISAADANKLIADIKTKKISTKKPKKITLPKVKVVKIKTPKLKKIKPPKIKKPKKYVYTRPKVPKIV